MAVEKGRARNEDPGLHARPCLSAEPRRGVRPWQSTLLRPASLLLLGLLVACGGDDEDAPTPDAAIDGAREDRGVLADGGDDQSGAGDSGVGDSGGEDSGTQDSSSADGALPDAASDAGSGVGVFIAVGAAGRRVVSCDDGRTWRHDTSFEVEGDPSVCGVTHEFRCYSESSSCQFINRGGECETRSNCDCDHHPGSGLGVTFGEGSAIATFGWGPPGKVLRTLDGQAWDSVDEGHTFAGIAYGGGTFLLAGRRPFVSDDGGRTFTEGAVAELAYEGNTIYNARALGYAEGAGGAFLLYGSDSERRDMLLSRDGGASWERPESRPYECAPIRGGLGSVMGSGDDARFVLIGRELSCSSRDGGRNWTARPFGADLVPEGDSISAAWIGHDVAYAWRRSGGMLRSTDGESWEFVGDNDVFVGAVSRSADGTFVAVNGGWNRWYEAQRFYRSEDGVTWEELAEGAAPRSHRIQSIAHGYLERCPVD